MRTNVEIFAEIAVPLDGGDHAVIGPPKWLVSPPCQSVGFPEPGLVAPKAKYFPAGTSTSRDPIKVQFSLFLHCASFLGLRESGSDLLKLCMG
jgi:hypothetical protein